MKKSNILISAVTIVLVMAAIMLGLSWMPNSLATISAHNESKKGGTREIGTKKNNALDRNLVPDQAVSDKMACAVFLRFIGEGRRTSQGREVIRKYIANALGFSKLNDQEILLTQAETFVAASNQITENADIYKSRGIRSQQDDNSLRQLGKNKSKLIRDVVHDLKRNLSADGWKSFNNVVLNRIKPKVKVSRKN